ncbi:LysR family transcriptional regulator [Dysgonomonas sp. HDW5A]|uniref:helix-turn-helix domain-containing protein n=1 Tax=Dysgonomonas sp. HDW5A TaxID=2714926 RepID=UPI001409380B|nr:LysR family transcriptional regulator [Dysgonomonas sp. HDW5A]QIK58551.1 LysR family transcriptional regulator [Dysgonomonas sp. HDW5A]
MENKIILTFIEKWENTKIISNFRLNVFHSVAVHLNFMKATEELYILQPAVTKNIKELETELDVKLFDRLLNKVALTEAGRILFDYA